MTDDRSWPVAGIDVIRPNGRWMTYSSRSCVKGRCGSWSRHSAPASRWALTTLSRRSLLPEAAVRPNT